MDWHRCDLGLGLHRNGNALTSDWHSLDGHGLAMNLHWIGIRLGQIGVSSRQDWHWIGIGLASDWQWFSSSRGLAFDWSGQAPQGGRGGEIILRRN